jgi:hypothetical protein
LLLCLLEKGKICCGFFGEYVEEGIWADQKICKTPQFREWWGSEGGKGEGYNENLNPSLLTRSSFFIKEYTAK